MRLFSLISVSLSVLALCTAQSTAGIEALVKRRLPNHVDSFSFSFSDSPIQSTTTNITGKPNDEFSVSNGAGGKIDISGNSLAALNSGLRWYLSTYCNVDIYWFIGSRLYLAPQNLPKLNSTHHGSSIVPWRYHFNTVTFSYTAAFWTWEDWELQIDWMALRGINLPLAWVGYEKILYDTFIEYGFSEADITTFLSGPAFQAWNRFGNIQGSWGGDLPLSWINGQFELQKKIVARMVDLGMTPVLPSFTGFVPLQIGKYYPNASFVRGDQWSGFPLQYTNVTFLEPFDPLFPKMQKSFLQRQRKAYGEVTHVYTLDQYNEIDPYSGKLDYLRNVTKNTVASLKGADPDAVWMLQGWLFFSSIDFWTNERVEAYLGGVKDSDMLILDLWSESEPQWQRTNSYYGKPWIWCQLHDYGGNMGMYGQVENVTINPIDALENATSTMVGMGLTMEGQEGNEVMYDILLDQAWSKDPLDAQQYFEDWVSSRYHGASVPSGLYSAWNILSKTVYNNTNLTIADAVTKSVFVLSPNTTGIENVTGHHGTELTYNPQVLVQVWQNFYNACLEEPSLWDDVAYTFDLTDMTRQVMSNAFIDIYNEFTSAANRSLDSYSTSKAMQAGKHTTSLLLDLDDVLSASGFSHYSLPDWIASARAWASSNETVPAASNNMSSIATRASYYEYNARNQITLWGPVSWFHPTKLHTDPLTTM